MVYKELDASSDIDDSCDAGAAVPQPPSAGDEASANRLLGASGDGVSAVDGSGRRDGEVLTPECVVVSDSKPGEKFPR